MVLFGDVHTNIAFRLRQYFYVFLFKKDGARSPARGRRGGEGAGMVLVGFKA
jgi:hypothetical protein